MIPLMMFPGRHVKEHIPNLIQEAKAKHPTVDFHYTGPLSDEPELVAVLEKKAKHLEQSGQF